ncbi:MAG: hypothetical protein RL141_841 [Candidatus Parcubacteria bacterium]
MKRIRIGRHAHTEQAKNDRDRPLSAKGTLQAEELGKQWRADGFSPRIVLASAAPRACRTTEIAIGRPPEFVQEELYFGLNPAWTEAMNLAFATLQYAPLRDYLNSPAKQAILEYAAVGGGVILQKIQESEPEDFEDVAVLGHAILAVGIGYYLSGEDDHILDISLGECEWFQIELPNL